MNNIDLDDRTNFGISLPKVMVLIEFLTKELKIDTVALSLVFMEDHEMERINWKYLRHEGTTDVITFDYSENDSLEDPENLDGEILISVDQAQRQAQEYSVNISNELVRLIIHGILHLLGYDDLQSDAKIIMKEKENNLVDLFFLSNSDYKINME